MTRISQAFAPRDRAYFELFEEAGRNVLRSAEPFAGAIGDYKSALQEHLQATGAGQPTYLLKDQSGPDHQKRFRIEVRIARAGSGTDLRTLSSAEGTTKKQAQQEAARLAFASLLSNGLSSSNLPNALPASADISLQEVAQ